MRTLPFLFFFLLAGFRCEDTRAQVDPYDSGGPLMPEQAAYDVTYYALDLAVEPSDSTIRGTLTTVATVTSPLSAFVLDLDPRLEVTATRVAGAEGALEALPFRRVGGKLWVDLPVTRQPGASITVAVDYGGRPRVAPNPPWDGGFTWARTADGAPWIATSCQGEGADLWWPVKDHVSDEPDSMGIRVSVPAPLVVATNGRLRGMTEENGRRVYDWFVSTPINTYAVALNIAPYRTVERAYESVTGEPIPVSFYVLPEDYERGVAFMPEIVDHLRFYEELLGPYPFRADKYGVAQTPHLGMEHQTIIAYGARFDDTAMTGFDPGFDALHHHELAHEWWGNLVTNADWKDMWIHEGFGTYMQALYAERIGGPEGYHRYMSEIRGQIRNEKPVAPREVQSSQEIYFASGGDIYMKGAWVLHTLRHLIGDEAFFQSLRRMTYPGEALESVTDGRQCRFVSTDDFVHVVEEVTGEEMDWFFELYVRQPELPRLFAERSGGALELSWRVPGGLTFPMPVEVRVGGDLRRVEMSGGRARVEVPQGVDVVVDPADWILKHGG